VRIYKEWARFLYADSRYGPADGIAFGNAHTDGIAYALFERAGDLVVLEDVPMSDPRLRGQLGAIATRLGLLIEI
jgi:hypothetical protein